MVLGSSHAGGKAGGTRLGRYRLVGKLQEGPLGALWAARIEDGVGAGTSVLVRRVLRRPQISEEIAHGLIDAARAAIGLEHEVLVPVLDVVSEDDEIGLVSYAAEGELLRAVLWRAGLKRSAVPPSIAVRIALDLLEALSALREHATDAASRGSGVCADNVLVTTAGRARLLEPVVSAFACAHDPWSHDPKWASYRAPETLRDGGAVDERADVFTVGVLLWELLRNRPLFGGARFEAVERSVAQGSIGRADSLRPQRGEAVDRKLGDAVARALERDPQARFASLGDMAAGLRAATQAIARADGVAAFVERFAAESVDKQRKLWALPGKASAKALPQPEQAPKPAPAPSAVGPSAPAGATGGVPDFQQLFTPSPSDAVTEDQPAARAPAPASDSLRGLFSIGDEPSRDQMVEPYRPSAPAGEDAAGEQAEGVEAEPSAARPPVPGKGIPKGAFVLGAAAMLVLVLLWVVGPFGGRSPTPTADSAPSSPSRSSAAALDAGAAFSGTSSTTTSAPGATEPAPDASAETRDGGEGGAAGGDVDGGAKAKAKPKGKKKPKPKYMPGTL